MDPSVSTHPHRHAWRRLRPLLLVAAVVLGALVIAGCAGSKSSSAGDSSGQPKLFKRPSGWKVVNSEQGQQLYQVNLQNREGSGRILIGRLMLNQEMTDLDAYLNTLHNALVERIRGQVDVAPFAEDVLRWDNGMIGFRTKMRGELSDNAIIIEGMTFSDGENAYFQYGLFREEDYQEEQPAYQAVLGSLAPLRGAELERNAGMNLEGSAEAAASMAKALRVSPEDYQSPKTHLGLVEWGTSRDAIIEEFGEPARQGRNAIGYPCNFLALDNCVVIYMFTYGKLTHGGYLIESDYPVAQRHVANYLKLTGRLARDFGRPIQSAAIWADPKYRDDGKMWGEALSQGHVVFGSVWNLGPAKMVHSLKSSHDGGVDHRILLSNDELRRSLQASEASEAD